VNKAKQEQMSLESTSQQVECLGIKFESDEARRSYFRDRLREYLKDPYFRQQAGFPIAEDEAIVLMSDPPYYTACPNPFLRDLVAQWNAGRPSVAYTATPMAIDVGIGKSDPLYKAHAYHTKVPHLAIVPSILNYTKPGDVVLDGFSGSGMTGIAAQWCGAAPASYKHALEIEWKASNRSQPEWGARRVVLNDLSPAATFISANQIIPFSSAAFSAAFDRLVQDVNNDIGWMYETIDPTTGQTGQIEYTLWSQEFTCPECTANIVFSEIVTSETEDGDSKSFHCHECDALLTKRKLNARFRNEIDQLTGNQRRVLQFKPTLISYKIGKAVRSKVPDSTDIETLARIDQLPLSGPIPIKQLPLEDMYHGSRLGPKGISAVHHLFLPRPLRALALLWSKADEIADARIRAQVIYLVEQAITTMTIQNRYQPQGFKQVNKFLPLVYYVPSQTCEVSPWYAILSRAKRIAKTFDLVNPSAENVAITTGDCGNLNLPDESIDYIFTDPPFGENIFYADLNYVVEAWHGVLTNSGAEVIVDKHKGKYTADYQRLMEHCFKEYYRVLRSGRWMTVVFSNSRASIWNSIQVSLQQAGFIVAEVTALDKMLGSYRQVTSASAVKQDLVISCYKPNGGLEDRLATQGLTPDTAWDFVRTHLSNLTVVKLNKIEEIELIAERDARRIFDRMVAWFVRHNTPVPLSSAEFQAGLADRFPERDGMFFLPHQIDEYDKARMAAGEPPQRDLFVDDERTAIDWLTDFVKAKPSTYQEVHPEFTQKTGAGWRKHERKPELSRLLDENFLKFDGIGPVPSQIHAYLSSNWKELRNLNKDDFQLVEKARNRWYLPDPNKQQDVEARRDKALLREFDTYKVHKGRKMKEIRLEVMRAGFKAAWAAKDYQTIIDVSAKVPEEVWQEDERLMMLHSMAETRLEAER
jgi:16S rRNA G966 N2-methylase RsmD